jgi:2-oxoglutarate/2-oxoacid ferredoxin oxidoreductase subunit alpha
MSERLLINGNEAAGEGAIRGGCAAYFGYPITPQNELTAYMAAQMPQHGKAFVQAESEVAAINMVFGAAAAGARAMTSSSSPGVSLKQEGLSYMAGAELPMVIVNVQRGGPGLGNIDPSQSDYFQAVKGGGHGDYRLIVLAPHSVQEMHDFTAEAFDIADRYRNPVMILADGRLGQMMEPITLRTRAPERIDKPWALTGACGRPQNIVRSYFSVDGVLEQRNLALQEKYRRIEQAETRSEAYELEDADLMLIAYGTCARLARAVARDCRNDSMKVGLLRPVSLWPYPTAAIRERLERVRHILVVEMSAGQMVEDARLAVEGRVPVHFLGRMGGGVPTTEAIREKVNEIMGRTGR